MNIKTKQLLLIGVLFFVVVAFLISTQSYFNNKEISSASDKCYESGIPKVESDLFALNYSFSCQKGN